MAEIIAPAATKKSHLLDAQTRKPLGTLSGHAEVVRTLSFSKDGKAPRRRRRRRRPKRRGQDLGHRNEDSNCTVDRTLRHHLLCRVFSRWGTLATSSYDKFVKLWDAATGKEVRTFKDHIDAVYSLAFHTRREAHPVRGCRSNYQRSGTLQPGKDCTRLGEPTRTA